ncbi:MAG: MarR family transcriptional regulator [Clostridia bacterium]|nr:MarR family transcriptional regulator [Clostridia bacterium]
MTDRFERFSFAISEISKYWHRLASEEMEKHGLKGPHAIYITTLLRNPEGLTAPQICEISGKDKADVSRMMSIMEKKGLVTKESVNKNLYRAVFRLTEEGKAAAEYVAGRAQLAVDIAGGGLTDTQRTVFYESLEIITNKLRELSRDGLPE